MKKIEWRNRYGYKVTMRQVNIGTWLFDVDNEHPWRVGDSFVDPSGGPLRRSRLHAV